jgi:hypothetical protein
MCAAISGGPTSQPAYFGSAAVIRNWESNITLPVAVGRSPNNTRPSCDTRPRPTTATGGCGRSSCTSTTMNRWIVVVVESATVDVVWYE